MGENKSPCILTDLFTFKEIDEFLKLWSVYFLSKLYNDIEIFITYMYSL